MTAEAAAMTLIYYLCAAPAPGTARLACEARQSTARTCELATAQVEAGLADGRRYLPVGCVVLIPAPPPAVQPPSGPRSASPLR